MDQQFLKSFNQILGSICTNMKRMNVITSIVMMTVLLSLPQAFQSITADPGDPTQGILYGVDAHGGLDPQGVPTGQTQVVTINPITGAQTPLLFQTFNPFGGPGLAFDKANGVLYMTDGAGSDTIYTIDAFGAETTVGGAGNFGNLGIGIATVSSLDFNSGGVLYGSANLIGGGGTGADTLVTINLGSGAAAVVGVPYGVEKMEAIGFDGSGQLWGIQSNNGGLYQINAGTGVAAFFSLITNSPTGGIVSMEFACDGTIYVGNVGFQKGGIGELGLVTIVGNTASYASIGGQTALGDSLSGLAFDTACIDELSPIGGEILSISTISLLVAGMQTGFAWILPLVLSAVGIGALVIRKITRD